MRNRLNLEQWIQELESVRLKLARLSNGPGAAGALREELAATERQLARAMNTLKGSDVFREEVPENKVVLVVDDNDELRGFVTQALALAGYRVLDAADGEETFELLRQTTSAIDLIVCDVILPGMKGPELVKRIRGMFPDIEVIFMSGYISEDIVNQDVEQIVAEGGVFLQKPFLTRKLLEAVHESLGV